MWRAAAWWADTLFATGLANDATSGVSIVCQYSYYSYSSWSGLKSLTRLTRVPKFKLLWAAEKVPGNISIGIGCHIFPFVCVAVLH